MSGALAALKSTLLDSKKSRLTVLWLPIETAASRPFLSGGSASR